MLVGAHRAGVDVEIRVQLLKGDGEVAGLQDVPDRRRSDALSQRGDDTPGHENVLRHSDLHGGFKDVTGLVPLFNPFTPLSPPERPTITCKPGVAFPRTT